MDLTMTLLMAFLFLFSAFVGRQSAFFFLLWRWEDDGESGRSRGKQVFPGK